WHPSRREADRLEAEAVERKGPSDRQQRDVTGGGRAIVPLDDVPTEGARSPPPRQRADARPEGARSRPRRQRPDTEADGDAVALQGSQRSIRVPRVIGRSQSG